MELENGNRRYGMSNELFRELHDLADRMGQDCEGAFVPRVGSLYDEEGAPRIMFIGKATAGWGGSSKSLEDDWRVTEEFYEDLYTYQYRSMFWYYIRNLTSGVYGKLGLHFEQDMRWVLDRVIWSNLMKIGVNATQPYGKLADEQRPLMEKILRYELESLQPDMILICTNDYESRLVENIFGFQNYEVIAEVGRSEIWSIVMEEVGAKVYWTRHPQGWGNRSEAERLIAEDFASWFQSHSVK